MTEAPEGQPQLRLVEGDTEHDWTAVYRANVVPLFRFAYARVGNRPDAEDICTQVFLRALPRLRLQASAGEIRAYLLATARTVLADHWAEHYGARRAALDDDLPGEIGTDADEGAGDAPAGARAQEVLARLSPNHRRVLELRFLRGYSVREAAREMGVSQANLKVLQHRALRRAAALGDEEERR